MFGEVIHKVLVCGGPVHMVLLLVDAITDPIETHVDGTGSSLGDGVIVEANGSGVESIWVIWVVLNRGSESWFRVTCSVPSSVPNDRKTPGQV